MTIHRLPIVVLCLPLAVAVTSHVAPTQILPPTPPITKASALPTNLTVGNALHHVKGEIEPGIMPPPAFLCSPGPLLVEVAEYRYEATPSTSAAPRNLALAHDPLMFQGKTLAQGRVLGSAEVGYAKGNREVGPLIQVGLYKTFDVAWSEQVPSTPWVVNAQNSKTGSFLTVYRFLRLNTVPIPGLLVGSPATHGMQLSPWPMLMFFGAETTKDVGTVRIDFVTG